MNAPPVALLSALALGAAIGGIGGQSPGADQWHLQRPQTLQVTGLTTDRMLGEASGLTASVANPDLYWTVQDSGNPPLLLAIDTTGALRGRIRLGGAANVDWEAVAVGPCGAERCVYIADTGDNRERRGEVSIYRVVEPGQVAGADPEQHPVERLRLVYPDHPHDVEAVGVLPSGELLLVSKGRSGQVIAFTVPGDAWDTPGVATARLLDTLPITPGIGVGRAVPDLAISPQADKVAVRTYREIYLFDRDPTTGHLAPHSWAACEVLGHEPQGEGITWGAGDWEFLLLSERGLFAKGTVIRVDCTPE